MKNRGRLAVLNEIEIKMFDLFVQTYSIVKNRK